MIDENEILCKRISIGFQKFLTGYPKNLDGHAPAVVVPIRKLPWVARTVGEADVGFVDLPWNENPLGQFGRNGCVNAKCRLQKAGGLRVHITSRVTRLVLSADALFHFVGNPKCY